MRYRIVFMRARCSRDFESLDALRAWMSERDYAEGKLPERRARVLRPELRDQPTFACFQGPMWDEGEDGSPCVRYEDVGTYEVLSR